MCNAMWRGSQYCVTLHMEQLCVSMLLWLISSSDLSLSPLYIQLHFYLVIIHMVTRLHS